MDLKNNKWKVLALTAILGALAMGTSGCSVYEMKNTFQPMGISYSGAGYYYGGCALPLTAEQERGYYY